MKDAATMTNESPPMIEFRGTSVSEEARSRPRHLPSFLLQFSTAAILLCLSIFSGSTATAQDEPVRGEPTLRPWLGEVTGGVVNVRTGASTNHFSFFQLRGGTPFIALGGKGDWVEIAVPADRPIWVHGDFLAPQGEQVRVTGSRVRMRASAGTIHAPLGLTEQGQLLKPTGKTDASGKWVEVFAPLNAHAWIHGDYVRRIDSGLDPLHLSRQHQQLNSNGQTGAEVIAPGTPQNNGEIGGEAEVTGDQRGNEDSAQPIDPNTVKIPAFESPRLKVLFEQFQKETEKNPVDWNFKEILAEMKVIETSSEDIGEVEVVKDLARTIQEHFVPLHRRLVQIQKQQTDAKAKREVARAKEDEILRRTGHRSTQPGVKYQAVGWVVPLGKHRNVEATHKLMKGNQLLYYLDGGELKLDTYVNKRVGIVGAVEEQDPSTGARLIRIRSIEVLSQ